MAQLLCCNFTIGSVNVGHNDLDAIFLKPGCNASPQRARTTRHHRYTL